MRKSEVVKDILEILDASCENASEELRKQGKALVDIADALEGQSNSDARAILKSVESLMDIQSPTRSYTGKPTGEDRG